MNEHLLKAFLVTMIAATQYARAADVLDTSSYVLDGTELVNVASDARIRIPDDWLDTTIGDYVGVAEFDVEVNSFTVEEGITGIHLSSYGIQQQGSAGAAAGRDVFLAIDTEELQVIGRVDDLGVSKSRGGRYMGCWPAYNDHLFLGDINGDGATDIGVLRESVTCEDLYDPVEELDRVVATHQWADLKWYVYRDGNWAYDAELDGECTSAAMTYSPWPALFKGPVTFVTGQSRYRLTQTGSMLACAARALDAHRQELEVAVTDHSSRFIGTWTSPRCNSRDYRREIEFRADHTFNATDLVAPCPPNVRCVWSGIVQRSGTWRLREGGLIELNGATDSRQAESLPGALNFDAGKGTLYEAVPGEASPCVYRRGGSPVEPQVLPQLPGQNLCTRAIQGKIAWDYQGSTRWVGQNVEELCKGAEASTEPARCFERVMHRGISRGDSTQWRWRDALDLCAGTIDAQRSVLCFEEEMLAGKRWQAAIGDCKTN